MTLITISEIISLTIVTLVIGYIFSGYIKPRIYGKSISVKDIKFAIIISAPAIILHELAHKFVAMGFGLTAKFYMWTFGLVLGLILRFFHSPFIILAPGYVGLSGGTPGQLAIIAFAGPLVNLILFFASFLLLKKRGLKRKHIMALHLTKIINMWLFIFNMLPIPPLDGSKVFGYLFQIIF
ncbi:MAG: M50 family metallopeptidase [Nanoarchaeota archaeon]|nr:M50 family metallopeptidase [Nanoarchaeota archaeon]